MSDTVPEIVTMGPTDCGGLGELLGPALGIDTVSELSFLVGTP